MGCGLTKVGGSDDVISPGRIYSTVKKAQVHHQGGVAYTYHFLDFLLGKEDVGVSSLPCLSSVREIPVRIREWCGRGYDLAAVHPFVHLCNPDQPLVHSYSPESVSMYRSLHRAVLIKEISSSVKTQQCCLETDVCFYGNQLPSPEVLQNYMKKVHDQADKGVELMGLLLQPGGGPCFPRHGNAEDLSSLHSSPSPTHSQSELKQHQANQSEAISPSKSPPNMTWPEVSQNTHATHTHHNNNELLSRPKDYDQTAHTQNRVQLFALYKHTKNPIGSQRCYSVTVPLKLKWEAGLVTGVDAHWLDHMNQHFLSGASLIDGFLCQLEGTAPSAVEGVFIFQAPPEDSQGSTPYDAIVVEQWTLIDGVAVKADYTPLLLSLAPFGWRLMCVLPTPLIRTNSDGSLATKQVLFLQRPVQLRKRRGQRRLLFKELNRTKRNSPNCRGEDAKTRQLMHPEEEEEAEREREREGELEEREKDGSMAETRREVNDRKKVMKGEENKNQKGTQSAERAGQSEPAEEGAEGGATEELQKVFGSFGERTNRNVPSGEEAGPKPEEEVRQCTTRALFSGVC
ncbi:hypothetical protein ACEWY4_023651 [Coilia grayii]|uniref:Raftlin n=1 Tax=Coilia grayii TaxID=363190 RepID=A0ABD1IY29_9TELE